LLRFSVVGVVDPVLSLVSCSSATRLLEAVEVAGGCVSFGLNRLLDEACMLNMLFACGLDGSEGAGMRDCCALRMLDDADGGARDAALGFSTACNPV